MMMPACDFCAHSGNGHGQCCDSIYHNSLGRDDDNVPGTEWNDLNAGCKVGQGDCYPGLICVAKKCQLPTDNPEAHAASTAQVTSSSSMGGTNKAGYSCVFFGFGQLGAAMMALKVALQRRHRGLLRRHQYSEVDASPIKVWSIGKY